MLHPGWLTVWFAGLQTNLHIRIMSTPLWIAEVLEVPHRYCALSPHATSVTGASLYKAAALGVDEFRRWLMDVAPGPATRLTVVIESPSTVHQIPMRRPTARLEAGGKSPSEQAVKVTLREMLGRV